MNQEDESPRLTRSSSLPMGAPQQPISGTAKAIVAKIETKIPMLSPESLGESQLLRARFSGTSKPASFSELSTAAKPPSPHLAMTRPSGPRGRRSPTMNRGKTFKRSVQAFDVVSPTTKEENTMDFTPQAPPKLPQQGDKNAEVREAIKVFRAIDTDNSGSISLNEFRSFYDTIILDGSVAEEISFFLTLDSDGDREISLDEFCKGWTRRDASIFTGSSSSRLSLHDRVEDSLEIHESILGEESDTGVDSQITTEKVIAKHALTAEELQLTGPHRAKVRRRMTIKTVHKYGDNDNEANVIFMGDENNTAKNSQHGKHRHKRINLRPKESKRLSAALSQKLHQSQKDNLIILQRSSGSQIVQSTLSSSSNSSIGSKTSTNGKKSVLSTLDLRSNRASETKGWHTLLRLKSNLLSAVAHCRTTIEQHRISCTTMELQPIREGEHEERNPLSGESISDHIKEATTSMGNEPEQCSSNNLSSDTKLNSIHNKNRQPPNAKSSISFASQTRTIQGKAVDNFVTRSKEDAKAIKRHFDHAHRECITRKSEANGTEQVNEEEHLKNEVHGITIKLFDSVDTLLAALGERIHLNATSASNENMRIKEIQRRALPTHQAQRVLHAIDELGGTIKRTESIIHEVVDPLVHTYALLRLLPMLRDPETALEESIWVPASRLRKQVKDDFTVPTAVHDSSDTGVGERTSHSNSKTCYEDAKSDNPNHLTVSEWDNFWRAVLGLLAGHDETICALADDNYPKLLEGLATLIGSAVTKKKEDARAVGRVAHKKAIDNSGKSRQSAAAMKAAIQRADEAMGRWLEKALEHFIAIQTLNDAASAVSNATTARLVTIRGLANIAAARQSRAIVSTNVHEHTHDSIHASASWLVAMASDFTVESNAEVLNLSQSESIVHDRLKTAGWQLMQILQSRSQSAASLSKFAHAAMKHAGDGAHELGKLRRLAKQCVAAEVELEAWRHGAGSAALVARGNGERVRNILHIRTTDAYKSQNDEFQSEQRGNTADESKDSAERSDISVTADDNEKIDHWTIRSEANGDSKRTALMVNQLLFLRDFKKTLDKQLLFEEVRKHKAKSQIRSTMDALEQDSSDEEEQAFGLDEKIDIDGKSNFDKEDDDDEFVSAEEESDDDDFFDDDEIIQVDTKAPARVLSNVSSNHLAAYGAGKRDDAEALGNTLQRLREPRKLLLHDMSRAMRQKLGTTNAGVANDGDGGISHFIFGGSKRYALKCETTREALWNLDVLRHHHDGIQISKGNVNSYGYGRLVRGGVQIGSRRVCSEEWVNTGRTRDRGVSMGRVTASMARPESIARISESVARAVKADSRISSSIARANISVNKRKGTKADL